MASSPIDETCVNALRFLSVNTAGEAGPGHPGMPLSAAPTANVRWDRVLAHNSEWPNRDRFGLSGPGEAVYAEPGFTVEIIVATAHDVPEGTARPAAPAS